MISKKTTSSVPSKKLTVVEKWMRRVLDIETPWTEHEIIYFRRAVGVSGIRDEDAKAVLRSMFTETATAGRYRITTSQDEKGRAYLLSKSLLRNGTPRKGCRLGARELDILSNFSHHTLIGLYRPQAGYEHFLPIYKMHSLDGRSFEYVGTVYEQLLVTG